MVYRFFWIRNSIVILIFVYIYLMNRLDQKFKNQK
jgi:putative solute:sodium symporter small subunit